MKISKCYIMAIVISAIILKSSAVYATETENYVKITQPIAGPNEEENLHTFDAQINIMGEATVGTSIHMQVYYGEPLSKNKDQEVELLKSGKDTIKRDEYFLKAVGATGTFNQLIALEEGNNNVILEYEFVNEDAKDVLVIRIYRKSEVEKKMIKSLISPQAIVDKIMTPTNQTFSIQVQANGSATNNR
ncbi:MAG: hypothetical protein ACRCSG_06110 [Cellulosilyticaceae bacterium]